MEMYVAGGNLEIAHTLNPALIVLGTSFGAGPQEAWNIWREALMGAAGRVIWDEPPMLGADGAPSERARGLAPTFQALQQGIGAQFLAASPRFDPVALLYSPASQRIQWLLDRRVGGSGPGWVARTSETEGGADDAVRRTLGGMLEMMRRIAINPLVITPSMLEGGTLDHAQVKLLVLPHVIAMSAEEGNALRRFVAGGGRILSDGPIGTFDADGRARAQPLLANPPGWPAGPEQVAELLQHVGVVPVLRVTNPDGTPAQGLQIYTMRNGGVTQVGIQADFQAGAPSRQIVVTLPAPLAITNMRGGGATVADKLVLTLDPVVPTLLAIAPAPLPRPVVSVVTPGRVTRFAMQLAAPTSAAVQIQQVDIVRPDGASGGSIRVPLNGTLITPTISFDRSDPAGQWLIRVRDMLGTGQAEARFTVPPP